MQSNETSEIMRRSTRRFRAQARNPQGPDRAGLYHGVDPAAPDGTRYQGYDACLTFWQALAADSTASFELEDTVAMGERAIIRWRFNFGDGGSVRGVNVMRVRDGRIVEALGYSKSPGQTAPLPE